ncbi:MAG: DUF711 family protein, partial [Candidatus Hadarchaeales archaeon]
MKFTSEEILETFRMLHVESLDIRAITLGINLLDCVSGNEITTSKIQKKIRDVASGFVDAVDSVSGEFGVPVTNRRIAVTPVSLLLGTSPTRKNALEIAMALERSATTAGVDLIGGFSALVEKGITQADSALMDSIPETLAKTEKLCSSVNVASTRAGINLDAINIMASKVKETARLTAKNNGIGCARLSVFCNAPGD